MLSERFLHGIGAFRDTAAASTNSRMEPKPSILEKVLYVDGAEERQTEIHVSGRFSLKKKNLTFKFSNNSFVYHYLDWR